MPRETKRTANNIKLIPDAPQPIEQAVATLKKYEGPKFDQTVELCMHLGIDPRQADQIIRGSIALPKGVGKTKRVIAFCTDDLIEDCLEAGAVKAGGDELVNEIQKGFMDFDVAVAAPDMMRSVSKLGRVLGPRGLMPSPKSGTVAKDVTGAVKEYVAGKIEYRNDDGGNIHAVVGKMSFPDADLIENMNFFIETIEKVRPAATKGQYVKKITISGTMTPAVILDR